MGTSPSNENARAGAERDQAVFELTAGVVSRRARGEIVSDEDIIAAHPELMPELEAGLARLRSIHRSYLAAQSAGGTSSVPMAEVAPIAPGEGAGEVRIAIQGYSAIAEVSAGGQGRVFKAVQESTGRTVAIKLLPGGPFSGRRHRARFDREADILASLNHPNIVGIIDRGRTADGSHFFVMEFIDGWCLDEYVSACRIDPKGAERIVRLFIDIACAIESAHRLGIVHRDLKPSNVRVDRDGRVHILDFGLARLGGEDGDSGRALTETGEIVGSLPWASPEQVSGKLEALDRRSDVYSLGVMLYHAMAGRFPYKVNGSLREVILGISKAVPQAPSRVAGADQSLARPDLDRIVLKALAKIPQERYASASDFAQDLEKFLAGDRRTQARRSAMLARLRWCAILLVGAMVCCGGAAAVWQALRPPQVPVERLERMKNSIGMEFVRIPAGSFAMGSRAGESGYGSSEEIRPVRLTRPFFMCTTEVTQKQYRAVMGNKTPMQQPAGDDMPVVYVTWDEANDFCKALSSNPREKGRRYRLPTEAEWEYACRAGTVGAFGGTGNLEDMGWFADNSGRKVHAVGRKLPNHWGLFDMHGGVREWCEDGFQTKPSTNVTDPVGRDTRYGHVLRGGSVIKGESECRSGAREPLTTTRRSLDVGFRVVAVDEAN